MYDIDNFQPSTSTRIQFRCTQFSISHLNLGVLGEVVVETQLRLENSPPFSIYFRSCKRFFIYDFFDILRLIPSHKKLCISFFSVVCQGWKCGKFITLTINIFPFFSRLTEKKKLSFCLWGSGCLWFLFGVFEKLRFSHFPRRVFSVLFFKFSWMKKLFAFHRKFLKFNNLFSSFAEDNMKQSRVEKMRKERLRSK